MFKTVRGQSGFTLIEVVCVLVVIAVLAAYLVPKAINISDVAVEAKASEFVGAINGQENLFWVEAKVHNPTWDSLTLDNDVWSQMKGTGGILVSGSVVPIPDAASLVQTGSNTFDFGEINLTVSRAAGSTASPAIWTLVSIN